MHKLLTLAAITSMTIVSPVQAEQEQPLFVVYPPNEHKTTAHQIFLIGTAPPSGDVFVNGEKITRSRDGHFAPTVPLEMGENLFTLRHEGQELNLKITRESTAPKFAPGLGFAENSLTPAVDMARMPGELVCFNAIAPANAQVSVQFANQTIPLVAQPEVIHLPSNLSALIDRNQPQVQVYDGASQYEGCTAAPSRPGALGQPRFTVSLNGRTKTEMAPGNIEILAPNQFQIAEVKVESGVARTGPSTSHSRLTPLPKGTRATITGREGEWLRLDYGAWIKSAEVEIKAGGGPVHSMIRSLRSQAIPGWTEISFPLQSPVPVTVQQSDRTFTLTLHNTTAQTDTFRFNDDPAIARLDWGQPNPDRVEYIFHFKHEQQWGYKLRYEGTTLVLSLRHPPRLTGGNRRPLAGMSIMLDPGHGSENDLGAKGPNGYPEKDVALIISKLVRDELEKLGATVSMTREGDDDLWPHDRVEMIETQEAQLVISLHYNALPDAGDAMNTAGIGAFWYHPQAHSLSLFLENYLVQNLNRPSYGVFWNNLALTRPTVAPAVLMELGFMINPDEFEWITDTQEQQKLARAIADGVAAWVNSTR
jgi:N-acetylmuramoyl-L-alanine amidase